MFGFFVQGLVLGFSIAAPVGPIGVLCLQRTLSRGRTYGLVSGLGAATADAFYGGVAGFGLTVISAFLLGQQHWIRLIGGLFLCWLGLRTLLAAVPRLAAGAGRLPVGLAAAYGSTLALTLANPLTILSFTAVFAGLGLVGVAQGPGPAAALVGGVFCGSAAWWLVLSSVAGALRGRLTAVHLVGVNRASGALITGFGLIALLSLL